MPIIIFTSFTIISISSVVPASRACSSIVAARRACRGTAVVGIAAGSASGITSLINAAICVSVGISVGVSIRSARNACISAVATLVAPLVIIVVIVYFILLSGVVGTHTASSTLMHMSLVVGVKAAVAVVLVAAAIGIGLVRLVWMVIAAIGLVRVIGMIGLVRMIVVIMRSGVGLWRIVTSDRMRRCRMVPVVRLWRVVMRIRDRIALGCHVMRAIVAMVRHTMILIGVVIRR